MAKIKFYTDEHICKAIAKGLRSRGIDAISCVETSMRTASDEEHLAFATREKRVLVTYDSDFIKLHASGVQHSGIAFSHRPLPVGDMISILLLMYEVLDAEDIENQIEFI